MAKSFEQGARELAKLVGDGNLTGIFGVDGGERSIPLEVGGWQTGPNAGVKITDWSTPGTGAHAVQQSFLMASGVSLKDIAKSTLTEGPEQAMERHVERVQEHFEKVAPREDGQYRESTKRLVVDNGVKVYEKRGAFYEGDSGD